jgi:CheY-like chemotaxis protein
VELAGQADVAVVDMVMPGLSGPETIPLLQSRNPCLAVIASSGCAEEEFRQELDALGVEVFLAKPVPVERLIEQLQCMSVYATA